MFQKMTAVFLMVALFVSASFAFDGYIEVTNSTGYEIMYVYVSHESSSSWEEDILGSQTLSDGETIRLDLTGYSSSMFDVKCEDEDGDTYTFMGINVATDDLDVTLSDLD